MNSFLYRGTIAHRRHLPVVNAFRYRVYQLYLDLDEAEHVLDWLSTRRLAPARWRRADHMGPPGEPLKKCVARLLAQHGYTLRGPVRLLTQLRCFGYVANPVSFYYCFGSDGETVERVIAEVTNTPWGERHCYVLGGAEHSPDGRAFVFDKAFHVSPFMPMDMTYEWRFSAPSTELRVHNNSYRDGVRIFDATLNLRRLPLTTRTLWRVWLRQPLMSFKVTFLIYFQAARLWSRRVPFIPHPAKRT